MNIKRRWAGVAGLLLLASMLTGCLNLAGPDDDDDEDRDETAGTLGG